MKPEDFMEQATAEVEAEWKGPQPALHDQHPERPRYRRVYNNWAGNPKGRKPDFDLCCEDVYPRDYGPSHQCANKAKHDPDHTGKPTACGSHSDAARKKRAIKRKASYLADKARWDKRGRAHDFTSEAKALIKRIADGHNDPRTAAMELVAKYPGVFGDDV